MSDDVLVLIGGLMSSFGVGFFLAYGIKTVRRFLEQI